jgi:hypothetical protein
MQMNDLSTTVALTLVSGNDGRIIAAGPITKQPMTRPYRVVIVNWGEKFSVHNQLFADTALTNEAVENNDLAQNCEQVTTWLESGDYYKPEEFPKAVVRFSERLATNADHIRSIFRPALEAV